MLKALTIFLGLLIIITRGLIVLSPGQFRSIAAKLAANNSFLRGLGVFVLVLTVLIFFALDYDVSGARAVMGIFGVLFFFVSLLLLALPAEYGDLVDIFLKLPDGAMRLLACIGVVVGILVTAMGFAYF
jgi:uncharacterized protein YjeT (DUF2065 family)